MTFSLMSYVMTLSLINNSGDFQGLNFVIFGAILILVVTFMPNGLVGFFKDMKAKINHRSESK
jgi:ABC-type branched-subunit amino acid transport system permease subunit